MTASFPRPPTPLPMIPVPQAIEIVLTETSRALWYDRRSEHHDDHDDDRHGDNNSSSMLRTTTSSTTTSAFDHYSLLGRISAQNITAPSPGYPDHNSSIMDGYAVKVSDLARAREMYDGMDQNNDNNDIRKGDHQLDFVIVGKVYAGDGDQQDDLDHDHSDDAHANLNDDSCHRTAVYVTTGAVVPTNYDAVIPMEDTELVSLHENDDAENNNNKKKPQRMRILPSKIKSVLHSTKQWTWIRPVGCDIAPGSIVLSRGEQIQPVHMALLSQVGVSLGTVNVNRLPRVGVLSTGNELLVCTSSTQSQGKIPDANRPLLLSQLFTYGNCIPVNLGIARDDDGCENIARRLVNHFWPEKKENRDHDTSAEGIDVLITTGGVSMGEKDIMESVFTQGMGGKIHFGRLNMKPGKPTTFITIDKQLDNGNVSRKLVFALPGNPVSASVCSELLVRPCLDLLHAGVGAESFSDTLEEDAFIEHHVDNARVHEEILATITSDIELDTGRPEYRRVALSRVSCHDGHDRHQYKYHATCIGVQRSSRVLSLRGADGMMILPRAGTLPCGITARKGMEFPVLLYSQLSMSSITRFKDSIHQNMWKSSRNDESKQTMGLGIIIVCNSDAEDNDFSSLCKELVTLFGGDTKVTIAKRVMCKLDKMMAQQLPDIISGPQMDGVDVIIVMVPSNSSAKVIRNDSLPFKAGLEVAHTLRPILTKNAPALAQKVRSAAASQDPMAALFENIVGTVRDNSSLLVTCTDVGLSGSVNALKGLVNYCLVTLK